MPNHLHGIIILQDGDGRSDDGDDGDADGRGDDGNDGDADGRGDDRDDGDADGRGYATATASRMLRPLYDRYW